MLKSKPINHTAFTRTELLVVVVILAVAGGFVWPMLFNHDSRKVDPINCVSNLKQVGLAFRIWEGDNGDRYPMAVYTDAAGEPLFANDTLAYRYFQVMSNELNNPQIVICPDDKKHQAATNYAGDFNSSHISYFIGLEADEMFPQRFLAGDTHLTNDLPLKNGILELTTNHAAGWTRERHNGFGNVVLADGSVQQFDTPRLRKYIQDTNLTERLLMPDAGATK